MSRFFRSLAALSVLALLALPVAAPAHHSVANYDMSATKEYESKKSSGRIRMSSCVSPRPRTARA